MIYIITLNRKLHLRYIRSLHNIPLTKCEYKFIYYNNDICNIYALYIFFKYLLFMRETLAHDYQVNFKPEIKRVEWMHNIQYACAVIRR